MAKFIDYTAFGGFKGFAGTKKKVDPYGALNPEQKQVTQQLGPYLQNRLNSGPTPYTGQLTSPYSGTEQGILDKYNTMNTQRNSALQNIIGNGTDAGFNDEFNSEVADPTLSYFTRNIQPLIEESLPTFSTARANVVGRNLTDLTGTLSQQRFDALQKRRDQALSASSAFNEGANTTANLNAVPREIAQAGLDRQYQDFIRQNTESQQYVNDMLNFLGISTGTVEPATKGLGEAAFLALIQGAAGAATGGAGGGAAIPK